MQSALFVETIEEAKFSIEKLLKGKKDNIIILTFNPNIQSFFKKRNIKTFSTADYSKKDLYENMILNCELIENAITMNLKNNKIDFPPKYYFKTLLYYYRFIWRHYIWTIGVVDNFIKKNNVSKVFSFKYEQVTTESPWIEDDQLYLCKILKKYCKKNDIDFIELKTSLPLVIRKKKKYYFNKIFNFFLLLYHKIIFKIFFKKKTFLLPNSQYNLIELINELKKNKHNFKFVFYLSEIKKYKRVKDNIFFIIKKLFGWIFFDKKSEIKNIYNIYLNCFSNSNNIKNLTFTEIFNKSLFNLEKKKLSYKDVYFGDLIKTKIKHDVFFAMKNFDSRCEGVDFMLKTLKPYMILSQFNFAENAALGYFASKHKIPSILISHGSHIFHKNQYAEKEHKIMAENILYEDYNHLFVQSPFAREMIIKSKKHPKDNIINVGPTLWGRQISKVKSDKKYLNIVHAGTLKYRHTRFYIYETADEYVDSLIKLCNAIKHFPKIKLTIKIRPQDYELTLDSLINLLNPIPNNVIIEYNKTFYEVLKEADLLISFSSTTIEEALANKVPVLLFGGNGRYSHIPCKKYVSNDRINKAVTYIESHTELLDYFKKLNSLEKNFNISDSEFSNYIFNKEEVININEYFLKNKF